MKVALFLGAGASVPFGKPTTAQLKEKLQSEYHSGTNFHNFLLQSLLRVYKFPDIEYVLQAIKDIVDFSEGKGNDYFTSLGLDGTFRHTMLVYAGGSYNFEQVVNELKNVYSTLKEEIFKNYSWKHTNEEILNLSTIYDMIFGLIHQHTDELRIFTTNYDQAIETYCTKDHRFHLIDGFQHNAVNRNYAWNGNFDYDDKSHNIQKVYLYKLHGSLNWKRHKIHNIIKTDEESISSDPKFIDNILIYPTLSPKNGKDTEPYKTILDKFTEYMKGADICIVIGFSFRDDHIKEVFQDFIKDKRRTLIVISPTAIQDVHLNMLEQKIPDAEMNGLKLHSMLNLRDNINLIQGTLEMKTIEQIKENLTAIINRVTNS